MTTSEFISKIEVAGVKLQIVDGQIRCTGPTGSLTSEIRDTLARLKTDILRILGNPNSGSASQPEPDFVQQLEPNLIEAGRDTAVLNQTGVRLMLLDGVFTIGIWSDLDGTEIRQALGNLKMDSLPVRDLDGAGIPERYKVRSVDGEPVPMSVLRAMEQSPENPWRMRDRMLKDLGFMSAKSEPSGVRF